ncbi:hypothetical protein DM860_004819 [Cuscuta australis]|uniref:RNase H type-1 domain-containing protein n=1 Tax=Cuscuta australis TaxID=267555 RepID=A0A328DMQ2_9ASTE|nr:hypothetical protein DM860_004819 [Cuscuta australis]
MIFLLNWLQQVWSELDGTQLRDNILSFQIALARLSIVFLDVGYDEMSRKVVFGVILLSSVGKFAVAVNGPLWNNILSALMAETTVCKEALEWLKTRGVTSVRLFSDCSILCHNLLPYANPQSYVCIINNECKKLFCSFVSCSVCFVLRSSNTLGVLLAMNAYAQAYAM